MNEQQMREKRLFRYSGALERGDFETLAAVLAEAEHDPILEQMILEMNEAYALEPFQPAPPQKETTPMTTVMKLDRPRPLRFSGALAAAAAALILVVGLLALSGAGSQTQLAPPPQGDDSAAALQSSSATPTPAPLIIVTATPVPMGVDPVQAVAAPDRLGALVCMTPVDEAGVAVYSRPTGSTTLLSTIMPGTIMQVLSFLLESSDPGAPTATAIGSTGGQRENEAQLRALMLERGLQPPLWLFVVAQIDDAVVQGWILADLRVQVIECPPTLEMLGTLLPTVPPPEGMPSIVPTSTPVPMLEPFQMTATAIIIEATTQAGDIMATLEAPPADNNGVFMTATAVVAEVTAQAGGDVLPPTTVPVLITRPVMTYVVQPGDTLAAITIRFDVTVEALRFANPNLDLNALAVGQSVVIPGVVDTATLEAEIASLSATLETLRGLVGTATATPMVSTSTPIPAVLCTVMSSQAINLRSRSTHDAAIVAQLPANTEMRVSAVEIGSADNVTWYRVETEVDGTTIRGGFVRSDQVEEITPCPTL